MQGKGFQIALTVFFVGLCGYYLFPSVQNLYLSYQMEQMEEEERQEYQEENRQRLDRVQENSLNLGLDLQGGMHVTLEVEVFSLLEQLASNRDDQFEEVLQEARQRAEQEDVNAVEAFMTAFEEQNPEGRLSRYFRSESDDLTRRSDNDEVEEYLESQVEDAVERAMEIVRNRVDRYGVTEPSIQAQGTQRIAVELPGVDDPARVRNLLESASQLSFHLTGDAERLRSSIQRIIEYYEPSEEDSAQIADTTGDEADTPDAQGPPDAELAQADTQDTADGTQADTGDTTEGTAIATDDESDSEEGTSLSESDAEGTEAQNRLLAVLQPLPRERSPIAGQAFASDTSTVRELLSRSEVREMIPSGVKLMWGANPVATTEDGREAFFLYAIQAEPEMTGDVVTDASVEFQQNSNAPLVSITMDSDGARQWARITGANVGEPVTIVLDGIVYSYANIRERIPGGRTQIEGIESQEEASDVVTVLKSGSLPAPVNIVEERTVGPTLGDESVRAGFISVVAGLLLVVLFMIMYYHTGGVVADIALLLNVILILGILAGFNATLTLPGIAGIVLTIGMAVDANVLIFDRIREEQATGKTLRAAISSGYEASLSAILDANITTFFVGVILYSFGVGPIQGFAVTLMAGILSSLFTAIIVTRLIFDYMVEERSMEVSYG
ncbi:MAG: protein translocase subunit SecD [Salinivenus sp.]